MTKNWQEWYRHYEQQDPSLLQRLEAVREDVARALAHASAGEDGVTHVTSICAGDGRDLLPALSERASNPPVRAVLVELDPILAQRACATAASLGLSGVEVRTADAGLPDSYSDIERAHVLLVCGVFGNISARDVERTIAALPALIAAGGIVIWTRGTENPHADRGEEIRGWFAEHGFSEMSFRRTPDGVFGIGVHRLATDSGDHRASISPARMFEFC